LNDVQYQHYQNFRRLVDSQLGEYDGDIMRLNYNRLTAQEQNDLAHIKLFGQ
jgi:hypothetical protein